MSKTYYTLCLWDTQEQTWFDQFGSYSKREVKEEADSYFVPRGHKVIVAHKDSAEAMIATRDALPVPRYPNAK